MTPQVKKSYFVVGILLCLLGAICFSTKAIFVKLAYRDTNVEVVTLLALRMIFSLPFFVVSALISSSKSDNVKFTGNQWLSVALIGCVGYYLSSLLDFSGLQFVSAGIERIILFIYPTIVLLICAILFRQKIETTQWLAVIVTYTGLALAFAGEVDLNLARKDNFFLGAGMIFACAITYAIYIVGSGRLIPIIGASKFNSYAMTFACVAVVVHFSVTSDQSLTEQEPNVYLYSAVMALFATVIPSYLIAEGIKRVGSGNAAIAGSVGPVSTIIQAAIFLNEPIFALQIVGTVLVVIGVLMVGRKKHD